MGIGHIDGFRLRIAVGDYIVRLESWKHPSRLHSDSFFVVGNGSFELLWNLCLGDLRLGLSPWIPLEQAAPGAFLQPLVHHFLPFPRIPEMVMVILAGEDEDVDDWGVE
jgi:hypothetical protein